MRHLFATVFAILLLGVPWFAVQYPNVAHHAYVNIRVAADYVGNQIAAVIVAGKAKTIAEIRTKYDTAVSKRGEKVRILLVPGHEPGFGGTEFGTLAEREVVVDLADELAALLARNPRYEVFVTRDNETWKPEFDTYFKNNWDSIVAWKDQHKRETAEMVRVGQFRNHVPPVVHLDAPSNTAIRLFGINKWAKENNIDIALHLHLNDHPRKRRSEPGKYSGFSIYVPESQYYNSTTTRALATTVFGRLSKYNAVSDYPPESVGIVEDQELIAVGSYNTLDAASMLIEYGYIYEPQFTNSQVRPFAVKDLAYQTYVGILDFFDPAAATGLARFQDTVTLPYYWNTPITAGTEGSDVFALQTVLMIDGVYPPVSMSKNDCPRTGRLGPCTREALDHFQKKNSITDEKEMVGAKTLEVLNSTYSATANIR